MDETATQTRFTRFSQRKQAFQGAAYEAEWLGVRAVHTTWDGERLAGTITRWEGGWPILTLPDGRWARLDTAIEVVA